MVQGKMPAAERDERYYTLLEAAREAGLKKRQVEYAVQRGDLVPAGPAYGDTYMLTDEQVEMLKQAARLVGIGVVIWAAIRVVQSGWRPPAGVVPT